MNCKRIKELITTGYIDGEINVELQKEVEQHLNTCSQCRHFEQVLRQTAIEPFKNVEEVKPPQSVWNKIKETIAKEKRAKELPLGLRDRIHAIFSVGKPVFAVVTVITVILMTMVFTRLPFNSQKVVSGYLEEQAEFLGYLDTDAAGSYDKDYMDLDTSIEQYFF